MNKTEDTTNNVVTNENQTSNSNSNVENNVTKNINVANKAIKDALKQKRFLSKNNVDINSNAKFVKVADNTYLIHVEHEPTEENERSTFFFVSYIDNNVIFEKQFVHKYIYDVYYDFSNAKIKTVLEMKGIVSTTYGYIKDGQYIELKNFQEPIGGVETENSSAVTQYYVGQEKKSKEDFDKEKSKYENNNFVEFKESAMELNDANIDKYVK